MRLTPSPNPAPTPLGGVRHRGGHPIRGAGATLVILLLCCGGGLLSRGDDEDEATGAPHRPRVAASGIATPVTSGPTTEPYPGWSSEPEATPTPAPTVEAAEAACVTRSAASAATVRFGEDQSGVCAFVPDYDFGVSARNYDGCVRRSRRHHVERYVYEVTCRYDHGYAWSGNDEPDRAATRSVPGNDRTRGVGHHDRTPVVPHRDRTLPHRDRTPAVPARTHTHTPAAPDYGYTPAAPEYDYATPAVPETGSGPAATGDGGSRSSSSSVPDVPGVGGVSSGGCTWVNSYYRRDGTHVSGYYRC
jgi:hypothetical protein